MLATLLNDFISMLWTGYFKAHDEQKPIYRSYIKPYLLLARKRAETSSINKHMKFRLILNMDLCATYVSIIISSIVDGIIFDFHDKSVSHHLLVFILFQIFIYGTEPIEFFKRKQYHFVCPNWNENS